MRNWLRLLSLTAVLMLAANAAFAAAGINLSWTSCGALGTSTKTFACAANTGSDVMVASYVAPSGTTGITGMEAVIDIQSSTPTMPDWWLFKNAGTCRQTALSSLPAGASCDGDYWAGQASGGISAYITPYLSATNRARLLIIYAVPSNLAGPVDADVEYFAFTTTITHAKSVGTGSCAGCETPMCIVLNEIKLTQGVGIGDFRIGTAAANNIITFQGESPSNCLTVPVKNRTWGAVKSLYR